MRYRFPQPIALLALVLLAACADEPTAATGPRSPAVAAAQSTLGLALTDIPVSGTNTAGETFTGTLDVTGFHYVGSQLKADVSLTGTLVDANGSVVGTPLVDQPIGQLPVSLTGTCQTLQLTISALDLNLLGMYIHLPATQVSLSDQSVPGSLLCAVSEQLGRNGTPSGLLNALGQLLNSHG